MILLHRCHKPTLKLQIIYQLPLLGSHASANDWISVGDEQLDRIWDEFIFVHMEMKPDAIIEDLVKPSGSTKSVLHIRWHFPTESTGFPFFGSTAYATNGCLRMEFRKLRLRSGYEIFIHVGGIL